MRLITLVVIISILVMIPSCNSAAEGYTKFTQTTGGIYFSFEYPDNFDDYGPTTIESDYVWISRSRWENDGWSDSSFRIRVFENGWNKYLDANDYLEKELKRLSESSNDFQVLVRSQLNIDGINGVFIKSSYSVTENEMYDSDLKEPTKLVRRSIYFNNQGYIWDIAMNSIEKVAEKDEVGWKHLIESFRFIE